jgi:hypothetical protein
MGLIIFVLLEAIDTVMAIKTDLPENLQGMIILTCTTSIALGILLIDMVNRVWEKRENKL